MMPIHPTISVRLTGADGNVFNLIALCVRTGREAGLAEAEIQRFREACFHCSSYDEALRVMMTWFHVE
jgi:hypothetical protein